MNQPAKPDPRKVEALRQAISQGEKGKLDAKKTDDPQPPSQIERTKPDAKKLEALQQALSQIEKQYGKGSIMKLGSNFTLETSGIPTGSFGLDMALGGKGVPKGRVVEIFGPESTGKTTLCLTIAANAQKMGGVAAFIDVENAIDPTYSAKLGVDLDNLVLSQPDSGEQALEITEYLVRSNAVDVIIVDSVAALVTKSELEGDMGDATVGGQARLMSQALRKLSASINRSQCCVIFTNQIREKIGVMFGNPETTPGGRALKFYASVRIDMRKISTIKEADDLAVGIRVKTTVVKNKVAPPFKKAEFDILFNQGISRDGEVLDFAVEKNIIEKSGAWFAYAGEKMGQGREIARAYLKDHPTVRTKVENEVRKSLGLEPVQVEKPQPASAPEKKK